MSKKRLKDPIAFQGQIKREHISDADYQNLSETFKLIKQLKEQSRSLKAV